MGTKNLLGVVLVVAQILGFQAWALPFMPIPCSSKGNGQLRHHNDLIHNVMVIDQADRNTDQEFAAKENLQLKQLTESTGATGRFFCGGHFRGAANLTLRGDHITTVAHTFEGACDPGGFRVESSSCHVQMNGQSYRVKRTVAQGYQCPVTVLNGSEDWAVLELEREVLGVKPFDVDFDALENLKRDNGNVIAIGYSLDFHRQNAQKKWTNPRHIGRCRARDFELSFSEKIVASDCDTSGGASGGSVLSSDPLSPKLLGLNVGNAEGYNKASRDAATAAITQRREYKEAYDTERGFSSHVLVSGRFAEALRQIERTTPKKPGQISSGKGNPDRI